MTKQEVIVWLREEAGKLLSAAHSLEESDGSIQRRARPIQSNGTAQPVTPEMLRARLRRGSSRVPQLAKEFETDEESLRKMIKNPSNGIVMEERGWLKLREM